MCDLGGVPTYHFDFGKGIESPRGRVIRHLTGAGIDSPKHFAYRFDDLALARLAGTVQPQFADFLDIACAVSIADRWAPRELPGDIRMPSERWHRRLTLKVPVREVDFWSSSSVNDQLVKTLEFLTDDQWSFEFVPRVLPARASEMQSALHCSVPDGKTATTLFSGGLDSFIGLIQAAQSGSVTSVVGASVVSNSRLRKVQSRVLLDLRPHLGPELVSVRIALGSTDVVRNRNERESTQRSRGFLYLAVGVVTAVLRGTQRLQVCENGVGAINLPYDSSQTGARNTKAMHPRALDLFAGLATKVLGNSVRIENVGLWSTKAQLCSSFITDDFYAAAKNTVTCDRFPWLGPVVACGRCTSCLLRRASLLASGRASIDSGEHRSYEFDPLRAVSRPVGDRDVLPLSAMCFQVEKLRHALGSLSSEEALLREFPEIWDVLVTTPGSPVGHHETMRKLIDLYRSYVAEWDMFTREIPMLASLDKPSMLELHHDSVIAAAS